MKVASLLAILALTASCAPGVPDVRVSDAWARATAPGQSSAAVYATFTNRGAADRLVEVRSDAGMAMLHRSNQADGIARMRMLSGLAIPAHSKIDLAPGATHIMLTGLATPLAIGAEFPLTLRFATSGAQTVTVAVVAAAAR